VYILYIKVVIQYPIPQFTTYLLRNSFVVTPQILPFTTKLVPRFSANTTNSFVNSPFAKLKLVPRFFENTTIVHYMNIKMSFVYVFLVSLYFSILVCIFVKYCYVLGVLFRRYILSTLYGNTPEQITFARTADTQTISSRPTIRVMHEFTPNNITYNDNTDTDQGTDTEDDFDDDDIEIETREIAYDETVKIDGNCYIGIAYLDKPYGVYLMNGTISTQSFFAFEYSRVLSYTRNNSIYYASSAANLDILKLHILPNGVYEVTIHTFWIRIIQRAWRKTYTQRKHQIRLRGSVRNQESFRNTGKYMYGTRVLPSIHGILQKNT